MSACTHAVHPWLLVLSPPLSSLLFPSLSHLSLLSHILSEKSIMAADITWRKQEAHWQDMDVTTSCNKTTTKQALMFVTQYKAISGS
jgi:hypothetical protein